MISSSVETGFTPKTPALLTRRSPLRKIGFGALGLRSLGLLQNHALAAFSKSASTTDTDLAVLNFALNLEYLEAEFYSCGHPSASRSRLPTRAPAPSSPTTETAARRRARSLSRRSILRRRPSMCPRAPSWRLTQPRSRVPLWEAPAHKFSCARPAPVLPSSVFPTCWRIARSRSGVAAPKSPPMTISIPAPALTLLCPPRSIVSATLLSLPAVRMPRSPSIWNPVSTLQKSVVASVSKSVRSCSRFIS